MGRSGRADSVAPYVEVVTAMERAIDSLSDPTVSTADALRRLLVVARRIDAGPLAMWIKRELEGYARDDEVPEYRDGSSFRIAVRFEGYGGASSTRQMAGFELPDNLGGVLKSHKLRMPLAEIEALARGDGDGDPQTPLPAAWLARFRRAAEENRVPHMPMYTANHAAVVVPTTYLQGLLDRIKTVALDLALGIEDVSTAAGEADGPTVESEPALDHAVASHLTMIFANNSTVSVASGKGATAVQIAAGDVDALLRAAGMFLSDEGVQDFDHALTQDGGEPAAATRTFLDRVRAGGVVLAGSIAASAAYDGLLALLGQTFPSHM